MQSIPSNLFGKYKDSIIEFTEKLGEYSLSARNYKKKNAHKLPANLVVKILLTSMQRSIQSELINIKYDEDINRPYSHYVSKSAFCQARQKIDWEFFKDLCRFLATQAEKLCPNEKFFKNYRLVAVDGTTIALPFTKAIAEEFKTVKNQYNSQCVPRCSLLMDVLNGWCYNAVLGTSICSEKAQFYEQLDFIPKNSILILDRLYPSCELIYQLNKRDIKFVMRAKNTFNLHVKKVSESNDRDVVVTHRITETAVTALKKRELTTADKKKITYKAEVTYRIKKVTLPNNEEEILLTNLYDGFTEEEFRTIYNYRWGIETSIDVLKNKLAMEYLSGYLPHSIRQDFYTAICQYNVAKFLHQLADKELQATPKEHNPRRNAKEYKKQANMALASSLALKALAMQIYNPSGVENFINLSIHLLCRFPEPVRPHRQYPRKKKVHKSRGRIRYDTNFKQTG